MEETMQARPEDATQQTQYVSAKEQMAFNVSAFFRDMSYAIMGQANYFYTDVLGLEGFQLAFLQWAQKLWDGINDPIMGAYFDRRAYTDEKARRFFKTTGVPIAILLVLMFSPLRFGGEAGVNIWLRMLFILLCYIPFEAMHTINGTAYMSYYNSITPNIQERSGVISRARLFSTMGSAVVSGGIPLLFGMFSPDNVQAKTMIFLFTAIGIAAVFVLYNALMYTQVKERIISPPQPQQKILGIFRGLLQNKLFFILVASNTIAGIINGGNTGMYFFTYNVGSASWQTVMGVFGLPSLLLATWLLPGLCRRFEKRDITLACCAARLLIKLANLAIGSRSRVLGLTFLNTGLPAKVFMAAVNLLQGVPDSIKGQLYWSMIADSVDYGEWRTAKRNDGTIYAMEGLLGKLVGAVGATSTAIILNMIHFVRNAPAQAPETMRGLFVVPLVIELVSIAVSSLPFFFYDLTRKGHARIIEELKERAGAEAAIL
ncbi:MAG: MFS transporter [Oscillospiraceae bacterium]|nr:MFS transporter [Oscillospiraceae bacterium]